MTEPEQDPVHKLDYRNPKPSNERPIPSFDGGRFLLGLGVGVAASAVIWLSFFPYVRAYPQSPIDSPEIVLFAVPGAKILLTMALLNLPAWRSCGIGLLLSIPVGALIFFGACALDV